jgi:chemotaxis protein CheD
VTRTFGPVLPAARAVASPPLPSLFSQRVVVGVADLGAANNPTITLSTYALGSCIAVAAYDSVARAGGLLHLMLPDSSISAEKARRQPAMFADTGLPALFRALAGLRADKSRLRLFLAGGAGMVCQSDMFQIGQRNIEATMRYLARHGYTIRHTALGGTANRTVHLDVGTGSLTLKTPHACAQLSLAG